MVADAADAFERIFAEGRVIRSMVEGSRNTVIRSLRQSGMFVPMAKKIV